MWNLLLKGTVYSLTRLYILFDDLIFYIMICEPLHRLMVSEPLNRQKDRYLGGSVKNVQILKYFLDVERKK